LENVCREREIQLGDVFPKIWMTMHKQAIFVFIVSFIAPQSPLVYENMPKHKHDFKLWD
jgi:predicted RNA binding protein with dsRBD fold (UPF0201 family)